MDLNRAIFRLIYLMVIGIVIVLYGWLIWTAGVQSLELPTEPDVNQALTGLATGVGGTLATNFGAFLGIAVATGGGGRLESLTARIKAPTAQALAALGYLIILIISLVFWAMDDLSPNTAEIIRTQGTLLFGVGVGALAVVLNSKT